MYQLSLWQMSRRCVCWPIWGICLSCCYYCYYYIYLAERASEPDSATVLVGGAVALVGRSDVIADVIARDVIELGPATIASLQTDHAARLSTASARHRALHTSTGVHSLFIHCEAEKMNQFSFVCVFLLLGRNWWISFTYIKESISYNYVHLVLACVEEFCVIAKLKL